MLYATHMSRRVFIIFQITLGHKLGLKCKIRNIFISMLLAN